ERERLRRGLLQRPYSEVRRERHLRHDLGKLRLGQRPVQRPRRRGDRRERARLRRGYEQPPHPEVRRERHLRHELGKLRLGQRPVPVPLRRGDRRERARLRRGYEQPPHPEVRRERHLRRGLGKRRLGQRPVPFPPRRSDRRERERLRLGYEQPAHPGVLVPVKAGPSPLSRQLPGHVSYAVTVQGEGLSPPLPAQTSWALSASTCSFRGSSPTTSWPNTWLATATG